MCTNIQTKDGKEFACRNCDECIAARKNGWVARAMAERATSQHCLVMRLSYRNKKDGSQPDAAKAFNYRHVQLFIKRLQRAYYRQFGQVSEVRYICAGEQGSKKGRVHYHIILFSDSPLHVLGKWFDFKFKPLPLSIIEDDLREIEYLRQFPVEYRPDFHSAGWLETNVHWSMWDHGHIYIQVPDAGGMAYVLKYALKEQFNVVKARDTKREVKAEIHGASLFRMSKNPPIGWRYLGKILSTYEQRLVVPPTSQIKVPNYTGYWYPTGLSREHYLSRLYEINERRISELGAPCPQYLALTYSVRESETDMEILTYGAKQDKEQISYYVPEHIYRYADHLKRCGGWLPCRGCYNTVKDWPEFWLYYWEETDNYISSLGEEYYRLDRKQFASQRDKQYRSNTPRCNPFCQTQYSGELRAAFEYDWDAWRSGEECL